MEKLPITHQTLIDLEEYLDNLADTTTSPDGGQEPNREMRLLSHVQDALNELERAGFANV